MFPLTVVFADGGTASALGSSAAPYLGGLLALVVLALVAAWLTVRHIPNQQLGVLREGVYAINPALFVVITEDAVYHLHHLLDHREAQAVTGWHQKLKEAGGFRPLIVGLPVTAADPIHPDKAISVDSIGIVT